MHILSRQPVLAALAIHKRLRAAVEMDPTVDRSALRIEIDRFTSERVRRQNGLGRVPGLDGMLSVHERRGCVFSLERVRERLQDTFAEFLDGLRSAGEPSR